MEGTRSPRASADPERRLAFGGCCWQVGPTLSKTLAKYRPQEAVLYVRTGWEFNGDWFPWTAHGKAKEFAGAFQRFVMVFRSVSPRFRIEWNVTRWSARRSQESTGRHAVHLSEKLLSFDDAFKKAAGQSISERRVRSDSVVMRAPSHDQQLRLAERRKDFSVDQFVSDLRISGLVIAILPKSCLAQYSI